jgi:hypothetical protein
MMEIVIWLVTMLGVFAFSYSMGYQAGRSRGKHEGFEIALLRAIEAQRPLDLLRRVLVPRRSA